MECLVAVNVSFTIINKQKLFHSATYFRKGQDRYDFVGEDPTFLLGFVSDKFPTAGYKNARVLKCMLHCICPMSHLLGDWCPQLHYGTMGILDRLPLGSTLPHSHIGMLECTESNSVWVLPCLSGITWQQLEHSKLQPLFQHWTHSDKIVHRTTEDTLRSSWNSSTTGKTVPGIIIAKVTFLTSSHVHLSVSGDAGHWSDPGWFGHTLVRLSPWPPRFLAMIFA